MAVQTLYLNASSENAGADPKPARIDPELRGETTKLALLRDEMKKHGLTEDDQLKLMREGLNTAEEFNQLHDEDFEASGIDIAARRKDKLACDQKQAAERVRRQKIERVQKLLDVAGLSAAGRNALTDVVDVETLRAIDKAELSERGVGIIDRQKLQDVCTTPIAKLSSPIAELFAPITEPEVMTEPQRRARHREQRHAQKRQKGWRRAKRLAILALALCVLMWLLTRVPSCSRGQHWAIVLAEPLTDCNSSIGMILTGVAVKAVILATYEATFICVLDKVIRVAPPWWEATDIRKRWAVPLLLLQLVPFGVFIQGKAWWWGLGRWLLPAANMVLALAKSRHFSQCWFCDMVLLIMLSFQVAWWPSSDN
jgi:hypothetical protein